MYIKFYDHTQNAHGLPSEFILALKSPLVSNQDDFTTIFDVSERPIHRLSYAVLLMSIVVAVAEKGGGKVHGLGFFLKIQMLCKILKL